MCRVGGILCCREPRARRLPFWRRDVCRGLGRLCWPGLGRRGKRGGGGEGGRIGRVGSGVRGMSGKLLPMARCVFVVDAWLLCNGLSIGGGRCIWEEILSVRTSWQSALWKLQTSKLSSECLGYLQQYTRHHAASTSDSDLLAGGLIACAIPILRADVQSRWPATATATAAAGAERC